MKNKIIAAVCVLLVVTAGVWAFARKKDNVPPQPKIQADRIYLFYQDSCPACKEAHEYVAAKYSSHPLVVQADLSMEDNRELLRQCAEKTGFTNIVIPVICADKEYFMGWSIKSEEKFDALLATLAEKSATE